jgi:uncharacterized protein (TIGR02099 family)
VTATTTPRHRRRFEALLRLARITMVVALVLVAVAVTILRTVVLPNADRFRDTVAYAIGQSLGQPVTLGPISGGWAGFRPWVMMRDVTVLDDEGRPALRLSRVQAIFGWSTLFMLEVRCRTLSVDGLDVTVRRDERGRVSIGGIDWNPDAARGSFSDWFFDQPHVVVGDAALTWIDHTRDGEALRLEQVDLRFRNRGRSHRFQLVAAPPATLGSALDLRGDFRDGAVPGLARWAGRMYLHAPYLNLGKVRTWVELPLRFESGAGEVEAWIDVADAGLRQFTADLRLAGARATLAGENGALDVAALQSRVAWRATADGFEASLRRLSLGLTDGARFPAADIVLRQRDPAGARASRLEVESDRIDLAPVVYFLNRLPVDARLREAVALHRPAGRLVDVAFWLETPAEGRPRFALSSGFEDLRFLPGAGLPGAAGLSGRLSAGHQGGSVRLDSRDLEFLVPEVFDQPLALQQFQAQASWRLGEEGLVVDASQLTFANADVAGRAAGRFLRSAAGVDRIELEGGLTRATLPALWRYLPQRLGGRTRDWLREAVQAGASDGVRFVVRGDLSAFPFDGGDGRFEVEAGVREGVFAIGAGWPRIEDISGKVLFSGSGMEINARGRILGARVTRAALSMADLAGRNPVLRVEGEAEGPTAEFLRYLELSPVGAMIGNPGRGVRAQGGGNLRLGLAIPVRRPQDAVVSGSYGFESNRLERLGGLPPLSRVQALLEFTNKGARVANGTAELLGGPVRFSLATQPGGGVAVEGGGRFIAARVAEPSRPAWLERLRGEADWRAQVVLRDGRIDASVESDLRGLAVDLPAPLGKASGESLPLRVQAQVRDAQVLGSAGVGGRAAAAFLLDTSAERARLERATLAFGEAARLPPASGIVLEGRLEHVVAEDWLPLAPSLRPHPGSAGSGAMLPVRVNLGMGSLVLAGREFHEVRVSARGVADAWHAEVTGREAAGSIDWSPEGRGRLVGRFSRLHLPEMGPTGSGSGSLRGQDLPEIDLTASVFRIGSLDLGALNLQAVPSGARWQLRKLDLQSPDGRIVAEGSWQMERGKPLTQMAVRVDARDVGRMLVRLGRPAAIAGGNARVAGVLEWEGSPARPDVASMSGRLSLEARQGRFLQIEPGIGKLFSVLSLQALPRRVTLDFKDVFSQGFAFDEVLANSTITRGQLRTSDLRMNGPSAKVAMMGELDLVHETQDLEVRVVPSVSDSIALGTAVVNPVAGLVAFIVGKALNNPLDRAIGFEYHVSGTWADPTVEKRRRSPPSPAQGPR